MKLFTYLTGSIIFIVLLSLLLIPLFLPDHLDITKKVEIQGPKSLVYDNINNLRKQVEHSAYLRKDSTLSKFFYHPDVGLNANFKWNSEDPELGSGDILITQVSPDSITSVISYDHTFKSFTDHYNFEELSPTSTRLTWHREGEAVGYFQRYLLYYESEKERMEMIQSLQNLKESIEVNSYDSEKNSTAGKFGKEYFEGMKIWVVEQDLELDDRKINSAAQSSYKQLFTYMTQSLSLEENQFPHRIAYVERWDTATHNAKIDFGYSLDTISSLRPEYLRLKAIPATNVYTYVIRGNFTDIDSLRNSLHTNIKKAEQTPSHYFWVEVLEPASVKDSFLIKGYQGIKN